MARRFVCHVILYFFLTVNAASCRGGQGAMSELEDEFRNGVREIAAYEKILNLRIKVASSMQQADDLVALDYSPEERAKLKKGENEFSEFSVLGEYAVHQGSMLEIGANEAGDDYVMACNPDYVFSLRRRKGAKNHSLTFVEQRGLDQRLEEIINRTSKAGLSNLLAAWMVYVDRLDKLVASEEFQIEKIGTVDEGNTKLVRIDYHRRIAVARPGEYSYGDCYVVCDPAKQWGVVEYAVTLLNKDGKAALKRKVHSELEMVNSLPVPIHVTFTGTMGEDPKVVEKGSTTFEIVSTDVPDRDFLISSFGLPEPNFKTGFSSRFWYTAILAAACLLGAWLIHRRRLRT